MDKQEIEKLAFDYIENSEDQYISDLIAVSDRVKGLKIFDLPIFAFGSATDELFQKMKEPSIIGEHFLLPTEWLAQAKTVISFFLPFTEAVRKGNARDLSWPSDEWLHGRIEGQILVEKLNLFLLSALEKAGYESVAPSFDTRFWSRKEAKYPEASFTSNWSERHVAYICGLGTFGLSKGLITPKGISGRFGSLVTKMRVDPDIRDYSEVYEYCSMCGVCIENCPVHAITIEQGKNHHICSSFLDITIAKCRPRFGCGKCQISVPCECEIPRKITIGKYRNVIS